MKHLVTFAAVLALAACGGGGSSGTVTPLVFTTFQAADLTLGQPDFVSDMANQGGAVSASTMNQPGAAAEVGSGLFIVDRENNRVLGYNAVPTTTGTAADFALGQGSLLTATTGTSSTTMNRPWCVVGEGGRLFVSDTSNHRVLIYNTVPTATGAAASICVGQVDLDSATPGTSVSNLAGPVGIHVVGTRLIVCDFNNHRVLVWNTIPTTHGADADLVLGQADFDSGVANRGGPAGAATMGGPFGVWSDGTRLAVADGFNNRVLLWTTFPTVNGQPADRVLGQSNFTNVGAATTATGMRVPTDVTGDATRLIVGDCENNRILIFGVFPTANGEAASEVLGQGDLLHGTGNDDDQNSVAEALPTARTMNTTTGFAFVALFGNRLHSGDHRNHRALIYTAK